MSHLEEISLELSDKEEERRLMTEKVMKELQIRSRKRAEVIGGGRGVRESNIKKGGWGGQQLAGICL